MINLRGFIRRMLGSHFLSIHPGLAITAGAILVFFHWFAFDTHLMLEEWLTFRQAEPWLRHGLILAPFLLVFSLLLLSARWAGASVLEVVQQKHPEDRYEGLVIFLSPPGTIDEPKIAKDERTPSAIQGPISDLGVRSQFGGSWRMPAEAVAHQLKTLRHVVVVSSADTSNSSGTWSYYGRFRFTVQGLIADAKSPAVIHRLQGSEWEQGVNMENARDIARAVKDAHAQLRGELNLRGDAILVDITGGYGLVSSIAAAAAVALGCRFAWINRNDYALHAYQLPTAEPEN